MQAGFELRSLGPQAGVLPIEPPLLVIAGPPDLVQSDPAGSSGRGGTAYGFGVTIVLVSWVVRLEGGVGLEFGVEGVWVCSFELFISH